jgi:hypothetical protein
MATFGAPADIASVTSLVKADIPADMNVIVSTINNGACGISTLGTSSQYNYYMCFVGPQRFSYTPSIRIINALQTTAPPSISKSDSSAPIIAGAVVGGFAVLGASIIAAYVLRRARKPKISNFNFNRPEEREHGAVIINPIAPPPPPPEPEHIQPPPPEEPSFALPPIFKVPTFKTSPFTSSVPAPPPPPPLPQPAERTTFDPARYGISVNRSARSFSDATKNSFRPLGVADSTSLLNARPPSMSMPTDNSAQPNESLSNRWQRTVQQSSSELKSTATDKAELVRRISIKELKPVFTRRDIPGFKGPQPPEPPPMA